MLLHKLKSNRKRKRPRRGRGIGSRRGAKSGRGQKGQRSRSGGRLRRGFEGGRTPLMRKVPKKRGTGYKNPRTRSSRFYAETVSLGQINAVYKAGELVTPRTLADKGLISTSRGGAKVVATGEIKKKIRFRNINATVNAKKEIEAAGAKIEATPKSPDKRKVATKTKPKAKAKK